MTKPTVIVLDFINDIAHVNGKITRSGQRIADNHVIEHANKVIAWARKHQFPVIQVKIAFSADYHECSTSSRMFSRLPQTGALILGEWGAEFHEKLDVQPDDKVIVKHRVSAFFGTDLEDFLHKHHIDTVILAGTATNMAVESTARDAHDRDYHVVVVADACETASQAAHEASLASMERFSLIINSDQLDEMAWA